MKTKSGGALEVKSLSEDGTFEGYGSIFNNVDSQGEKVVPGAFAESLAKYRREGRRIKLLFNHDPNQLIGTWVDLAEDGKGLWGKARINLDTDLGKQVHALLKRGDLDELSIGYREDEVDQDQGVRKLVKLDLREISAVTFAANQRARVDTASVKSDAIQEIVDKLAAGELLTEREFERLAKGLGLSNSQAERAARVHLKGQGEPAKAEQDGLAFLKALKA